MKATYKVNEVNYIVIKDSNNEEKFRENVQEFLDAIDKSFDEVFLVDNWVNFEGEEEIYASYAMAYKSWMDLDDGDYLVCDVNSEDKLVVYSEQRFNEIFNIVE